MTIEIRILGPEDGGVLIRVAPDVFDNPLDPALCDEFLRDPRHHLAVALDGDTVIGFASGVHYIHPDKPPEMWINEVGVAPEYRRAGLATRVLDALFDRAAQLGCREAWVLTNSENLAAMRLYLSVGGQASREAVAMFSFPLAEPRPDRV
jgi:aminoglycoside 6'-N-acetyltransferase I